MTSPRFEAFRKVLKKVVPSDDKPVLVYVSATALVGSFAGPSETLPEAVLNEILVTVGEKRTLLMPTFTDGLRSNLINLDVEASTHGRVTELFRKLPGTRRSASRFYSYAIRGPLAEQAAACRPEDVWGEGSVLAWLEKKKGHVVMIGRGWLECHLFHRAEWLAQVPYRYAKRSEGKIKLNGKTEAIAENLYVRRLVPWLLTEWNTANEALKESGAKIEVFNGAELMSQTAPKVVESFLKILKRNPNQFVVENASESAKEELSA